MRKWMAVLLLSLGLADQAQATSCMRMPPLDPAAADFDPLLLESQAREDLAYFPLVAEVELLRRDPRVRSRELYDVHGLVHARVLRYYRQPLNAEGQPEPLEEIALVIGGRVDGEPWQVGEQRLVLATPETDEARAERQHPDPEWVLDGALPADIEGRIWFANSSCRPLVYGATPAGMALRAALLQAMQDPKPTGELLVQLVAQDGSTLSGYQASPMDIEIESLDDGRRQGAQVGLTQHTQIELPVGRYRLHWPGVIGARSWCASPGGTDCLFEIRGGLRQQMLLVYEGLAHADVQILDAAGQPVDVLAWIALRATTPAAPGQPAQVDVDLGAHTRPNSLRRVISERPRYRVREGEYAVVLRNGPPNATCRASDPHSERLGLRMVGEAQAATAAAADPAAAPLRDRLHLPAGRSLVRAYLPPDSAGRLYRLTLIRRSPEVQVVAAAHCHSLPWSPDWDGDTASILVPRGSIVDVAQYCTNCSTRSQKLTMDRDHTLVLD